MMSFTGVGVLADGMVISQPDLYAGGWDYSDETDQQAFINFHNGLEKMVVGVDINGIDDKNAVWLFPVPARPEKVVIDVVDQLPEMSGVNVASKASGNLPGIKNFLFNSQIYPALSSLFGYRGNGYAEMPNEDMSLGAAKSAGTASAPESDVTVYEHLDKEGISSEIITAKTANGIYDYFENKGLKIEKGMIPALDAYIGKDYSFVASWIDNGVKADNGVTADDWANHKGRQYIEENLESYLGIPVIQAKLYGLKQSYPALDVQTDANGSYQVNGDQVIPYLKSAEGSAAMDELAAAIDADTSLNGTVIGGDKALVDDWSSGSSADGVSSSPSSPAAVRGPVPVPVPSQNYPSDYWSEPVYQYSGIKGISVYFPTDDIYFPLLPTSVYESKIVPATIKVVGYVDPRIYENIKNFSKVSYYTDAYYYRNDTNGSESQLGFFDNTTFLNYTKIEINAPSKYLTEDLWMRNRVPFTAFYPAFIADHSLVVSLILLVLCSLIAAFIAGMILLKDLRAKPGKLALLGLSNCLTLAGLIAAVFHIGETKVTTKENAVLLEKIKNKGYFGKRKRAAAYFIAAVLAILFMILGSSGLVSVYYGLGYYMNYQSESLIGLFFLYLPPVLLFFGWRAAQVAVEDKPLFAELKAKGYSTWSFRIRNRFPWLFVALFSAVFLVLAATAVWLLGISIR